MKFDLNSLIIPTGMVLQHALLVTNQGRESAVVFVGPSPPVGCKGFGEEKDKSTNVGMLKKMIKGFGEENESVFNIPLWSDMVQMVYMYV